jgi:hypothetical protein
MPEVGRRAPDWEWDEIVLACDLVARTGWQGLPADNSQVIELSQLLRNMSIHPAEVRGDKFRNPNGVGRKTADLATNRSGYQSKPTNGGRRDKDVIERFLLKPDVMHAMAESIRASATMASLRTSPAMLATRARARWRDVISYAGTPTVRGTRPSGEERSAVWSRLADPLPARYASSTSARSTATVAAASSNVTTSSH